MTQFHSRDVCGTFVMYLASSGWRGLTLTRTPMLHCEGLVQQIISSLSLASTTRSFSCLMSVTNILCVFVCVINWSASLRVFLFLCEIT